MLKSEQISSEQFTSASAGAQGTKSLLSQLYAACISQWYLLNWSGVISRECLPQSNCLPSLCEETQCSGRSSA